MVNMCKGGCVILVDYVLSIIVNFVFLFFVCLVLMNGVIGVIVDLFFEFDENGFRGKGFTCGRFCALLVFVMFFIVE